MAERNENRSHFLAVTIVTALVFQIFLSVLILRELRGGGNGSPSAGEAAQGLPTGAEAPHFRLPDARENVVSLADFKGRRVMLVFSSDRCPYCREMYPELKRFQEGSEGEGLRLVLLQAGSTPAENEELALSQGFGFPVLAADMGTFQAYEVPGTPFSTVIDEEGRVVAAGVVTSYEQMASLTGSAVEPRT